MDCDLKCQNDKSHVFKCPTYTIGDDIYPVILTQH